MSEQVSIQPEELESTSEKLDSILDRLNALGASAAKLKASPAPVLKSVPDLPPVEVPPEVQVAEAVEAPELTPPAIPQLDLVPPVLDGQEFTVPDLPQGVPDISALIDPRNSDALAPDALTPDALAPDALTVPDLPEPLIPAEPFEPIDEGDPIESVTEIAAEDVDPAPLTDVTAVEPEVFEPVSNLFEVTETEAAEVEVPEIPEVAEVAEAPEVAAVDLFEASTVAEAAPEVLEPTAFDPWAIDASSQPAESTTDFTEQMGLPSAETEVHEPVVAVEVPQVATEPTPTDFPTTEQTTDRFEQVSTFEDTASPVEAPTAPASIFGSSSSTGETANEPTIEEPATAATDGWISHHEGLAGTAGLPGVDAESPAEAQTLELVDQTPAVGEASSAYLVDPVWADDPALTSSPFFDQDATDDAASSVDMATEVEETLNGLAVADVAEHSFLPPEMTNAIGEPEAGDVFETDDDLPLPDFTGVFDAEEAASTEGVESRIDGLSVRREEIDKLRPTDDLGEKVAALEKARPQRVNATTIICFIVMIALAILVWSWFTDASVVEDIRRAIFGEES